MKYYFKILLVFIIVFLFLYDLPVKADLPLQGKVIVVDAGHGGKDPGTSYQNIYEKDINLKIALYLEKYLSEYGATTILTRNSDADLSYGETNHRKKTDFDNRIKIINNKYTDMYLSIHLNYLTNTNYYGAQVFYNKDNYKLATSIQEYINANLKSDREVKEIPSTTYMYEKLEKSGVLIECGFLSNYEERMKLIIDEYQKEIAKTIADSLVKYFNH